MRRWVPLAAGFLAVGLIVGAFIAAGLEREPERVVAIVPPATTYTTTLEPYSVWAARVAEEAARVAAEEAARLESERQRVLDSQRVNASSAPRTGISGGGFCEGDWPIDGHKVWIENRECTRDPGLMSPPSFCSGRGCVGPLQIDQGHFYGTSPWNNAVPGTCADLDGSTLEGQFECARRLGEGHWG